MTDNKVDLRLKAVGRRDSTQSPAPCDGCYYHNQCGRVCFIKDSECHCAQPHDDGSISYYIYVVTE